MKKIFCLIFIAIITASVFAKGKDTKKEKQPEVQKPAVPVFDESTINKAIENGDCAFLWKFTQSENPDPALLAKAKGTIKFYTGKQGSVATYHTDKMDGKVRKVPQEIADGIFKDPKTFLPQLVTFLANGAANDFAKAKLFHDWICDNIAYDADLYFKGVISGQDYISVIKKKKAVCSGYAATLNQMCSLAGIQSKTISGFSKGYGFKGKTGSRPDHDWNAIKISGHWYLVDATWDAGYLDYKTFIKKYSTQYLFWDSRTFLYSHLAQKEGEQFYAPPLTKEQFEKEPKVEGKFFQKGLSFVDDKLCYSNETNGEFQVEVKSNSNIFITNNLVGERETIEGAAWTKRKSSTITLCFDVPDGANYQGCVYSQKSGVLQDVIGIAEFEGKWIPAIEKLLKEKKITQKDKDFFDNAYFKVQENYRYYLYDDQFAAARNAAIEKISKLVEPGVIHTDSILSFNLKATSDYEGFGKGKLKYPYRYISYNNATNTELIAPITGKLQAGTTEKFEIRSTNFTKFAFIINDEWFFFEKNTSTGNFEIELEIPTGIEKLEMLGSSNGKNFAGLISFEIVE